MGEIAMLNRAGDTKLQWSPAWYITSNTATATSGVLWADLGIALVEVESGYAHDVGALKGDAHG